jgi:hypothetical protein
MGNNIADKVEELIRTKLPDDTQIEEFVKANEEYQKLIQMGLAKERGFSILTTGEIYLFSSNNFYCQSPK